MKVKNYKKEEVKVKILKNKNKKYSYENSSINKSLFEKYFYGILKVVLILDILILLLFCLYKINSYLILNNNINKGSNYTILITEKDKESKTKFINMLKKKLHLKNDLSNKILHILYNTIYKNTDINQYLNYTKLLKPIEEKEINSILIDPSKLLIKSFFTKEYAKLLNLNITNNQDRKFDPVRNKNARYYLERYFVYLCRNGILLDKNRYKLSKHPKISIILATYNRAEYIEKVLLSIQNQNLKDIEIIFVDDVSKDNSTEIIEKFMKEDDRIVLLKNKKNSGPFYSRFTGIVFSRGDYISFADPDDFYLPDILGNAYNVAIMNNLEIVHYPVLEERRRRRRIIRGGERHTPGVILTANELKYYMFYEHHKNYAKIESTFIWDKIYKRNLLLKSMHEFPDNFLNEYFRMHDDNLFLFVIFQNANSYYFLNQYGYYWFRARPSTYNKNITEKANKDYNEIFKSLRFIFNYVPDEEKYKMMCFANFEFLYIINESVLKYVTEGIEFMKDVINLYLNCRFYNKKQKKMLMKVLNILNENQARITKK